MTALFDPVIKLLQTCPPRAIPQLRTARRTRPWALAARVRPAERFA